MNVDQSTPTNVNLHAQLLALWRRYLNDHSLTIDDDFFEKGGDSLLATDLLLEVQKLTGVEVSGSVLFAAATVRQLAERLSDSTDLKAQPVIQMSSDRSRDPLIFFHGDFTGGGFFVNGLARLLADDSRLIVVAPHGVESDNVPSSIEKMAADRLPLILKAQPNGPYRLAGHCNGALVAFEAARLLLGAGHKVELVAMIDPVTVNVGGLSRSILWVLSRMTRPHGLDSTYWQDCKRDILFWAWQWLIEVQRASCMSWPQRRALIQSMWKEISIERLTHMFAIFRRKPWGTLEQYQYVLATYFPKPLPVPVVYFSAESDGRPLRRITLELEIIELPDAAARRVNPDFAKIRLPGHHYDWVTNHVDDLADHLRALLQRADAQGQWPQSRGLLSVLS
jgi:oxalate---CoA ligase